MSINNRYVDNGNSISETLRPTRDTNFRSGTLLEVVVREMAAKTTCRNLSSSQLLLRRQLPLELSFLRFIRSWPIYQAKSHVDFPP
ncbi:hypothetical protein AAMO2058_001069200 [Amorphochlora amoebiformis]